MKSVLPKLILLLFVLAGSMSRSFSQKLTFEFVDSTSMTLKPVSPLFQQATKVYVTPTFIEDTIYSSVIENCFDKANYKIVYSMNEADFILKFNYIYSNQSTASQNLSIPGRANDPRYVPTSSEANLSHNFDSNKTAFQNASSKKKSSNSSPTKSSTKAYTYSELWKFTTIVELYDRNGQKVDESKVNEEVTLVGYSANSNAVAKKDLETTKAKTFQELPKAHLPLAMNYLNDNYFFYKTQVPVFVIKAKGKEFSDWNDAVEVLKSIIQENPLQLNESRKVILEDVLLKQVKADYSKLKDSALIKSAAIHNLAVLQYYNHQPIEASATFSNNQLNLIYSEPQQRYFKDKLLLLVMRGQ